MGFIYRDGTPVQNPIITIVGGILFMVFVALFDEFAHWLGLSGWGLFGIIVGLVILIFIGWCIYTHISDNIKFNKMIKEIEERKRKETNN